jgi:3-deoxy-manno-octulosonate cytidylyltransferase (CMP-KDO synthetase)
MAALIIIPARYASTRYPGKPLVGLRGAGGEARSLIRRTWDAAMQVGGDTRVVVATDDERIWQEAEGFGAEVVMTSSACRKGTERCAEAHAALGGGHEIIVNLQGDAALTPPWFVGELVSALASHPTAKVATPVLRTEGAALARLVNDRREGRIGGTTAVFDRNAIALYFSKEVVPHTSNAYPDAADTPVSFMWGSMPIAQRLLLPIPSGRWARSRGPRGSSS